MSGPPPSGRGRGGRGRGGGRSGSSGGGRNSSSSSGKKSDKAPKKKGRGGGKASNNSASESSSSNNNNNNNSAAEKEKAAKAAEQQKRREQQQEAKADQEKAAEQARLQAVADEAIVQAHEVLQSTLETLQLHQTIRTEMKKLIELRQQFESNKKKLKTDLKKCTAFVKKVKSGAVWALSPAAVQADIANLNLSRYIEEVVNGLLECTIKPKLVDLHIYLTIIRNMHIRYANFVPLLVPQLWAVIQSSSNSKNSGSKNKQQQPLPPETIKLRRLYMRLLVRMVLAGIWTETKPLAKCLGEAAGASEQYQVVPDPMLVVAFGKAAGLEVLGIVPRSLRDCCRLVQGHAKTTPADPDTANTTAVVPTPALVARALPLVEQVQAFFKDNKNKDNDDDAALPETFGPVCLAHCQGAYQYLQQQLSVSHTKLLKLEQRCDQDRLLSGSLPEAREKGLADARKIKESLIRSVEALADVLDRTMPVLEAKEAMDDYLQTGGLEVWTKTEYDNDGDRQDNLGPFDDEETRAFYCDVPDLLTTIPPALLGLTAETIDQRKERNAGKYGNNTSDNTADNNTNEEEEEEQDAMDADDDENNEEDGDFLDDEEEDDDDDDGMGLSDDEGEENEAEQEETDTPHYRLMVLLEQELPECHRREQLDEITDKFCTNHGSTKNSRKRLSKALFHVPRARLDLLPYYARLAASLDRVWPDIAEPLVTALEQQFHGQCKFKKNHPNMDARLKTARYIGELTKFRVAPPMVLLRCLRRCLDDLSGNNVDVACCLLESAGRFLYRMPHTCARLEALMETILRLSKAKMLDERQQLLIKAAFHSVKPPPTSPRKKMKRYPPLESYVRHLLMVQLEPTDSSISFTVKQLIRLPWSDPSHGCGSLVCRIMLKACRRGRYRTIHAIAAVADKLRAQRAAAEASVRLLDAVLEELRWALEHPDFRDQQRTITYARLLGELYCLQHINGQLVIDQLYDFINIGHDIPDALREASTKIEEEQVVPSILDPANTLSQTIEEDEELEAAEEPEETEKENNVESEPVAVSEHSKYDPRVPSATDPPNSAYRVKLVCTTLEVTAKKILTRVNLPRVRAFLAAFQRYLFTKSALPADVEFSLLDTFDVLDSQWKRFSKRDNDSTDQGFVRYRTWIEAHNATVSNEESEAQLEIQRRLNTENLADESKSVGDLQLDEHTSDDGSLIDDEDDASVHTDAEESIEDDGDMSSDAETATKDIEEEYEEEFDEDAYMQQLEEEEFEREIRRLTKDALDKGKSASRKLVHESMISGSQVVKKKPLDPTKTEDAPANPFASFGKAGVTFQVLKKGNKGKVEAKDLIVPSDTNLARVASKQDGEAARERDAIKERVLRYEMDSAEAELTGGNVYLEQSKLQVIRNKQLSMDTIDKNFGTKGGNLQQSKPQRRTPGASATAGRGPMRGGPGRGRGRGRSTSGRTLFRG